MECIDDLSACTGKCVSTLAPKCRSGQAFDPAVMACVSCKAGTVVDVKANRCVECPENTYHVTGVGSSQCVKCAAGKSTRGKTGQTECA